MNWKQSLDRYLTTEPDDGFNGWTETVIDTFYEGFYIRRGTWIDENNGLCNKWLNALYYKGMPPEQAAQVIMRAHKLYRI
jgi:hypothetical protein